jgi:hypothetical protein
MDPFNAPSWGSAPNYQADLQSTVANTAPLAQNYNGAQTGVNIQQVFNKAPATPQASNLSKFAHFIGGVGSEIGHIATGAATWLGKQTAQAVMAPVHYAQGISHGQTDQLTIKTLSALSQQSSNNLDTLHTQFKSGKITAKQYQSGLKDLINLNNQITEQQMGLQNRIKADQQQTTKAAIDTAATVVTVLTAGFGRAAATAGEAALPLGERAAANYIASTNAKVLLDSAEQGLNKLATNPELFAKLTPEAQNALQTATAEVIAGNSGSMTSAQIARAAAANVALKYPIYYNMLSTTGQDIYKKLDDRKYGQAVQQMAFNAALLLSGGVIGQALKYGSKTISGAAGAVFGKSSFIDELSKGIGDGNASGLYRTINAIEDPAIRKEAIQNLSAVEATNLSAVAGKDPVAAAWRVLNGMSSYEGASMSEFTHEEALNNMVNFAKAQRLVDTVGKANNLGPITVGRVDARQLNKISAAVAPAIQDGKDTAKQMWEAIKSQNPTQAWANNENFDKQIVSIINRNDSPESIDSAIRSITASFHVEGFPAAEAKQLSKMGYIPIKPVNLEAPFKEGEGTLTSKFGEGDFFNKSVQPLPVLSSVGSFLTRLGLSPTASTGRVYQLFNQNLSENLGQMQVVENFVDKGVDRSQTADNIVKKLSNYAHNPTRGTRINGKPLIPITDLRQMTTKDIMEALTVSQSDAKEVKGALMDSMLQVPLQVRGLGDKLVDLNYKLNPTAGRYARIQGAARFAWNPFFQAKLSVKTELLSQAEVQGKFPTLGGTNSVLATIFPDKYRTIDDTRTILRNNGIFDTKANFGEAIGGEGVNDVGVAGANLTHKLIPSQERSLASMVQVQADRMGLTTKDFVENYPNEVRDTVQMIAQYDRNSEFLNSAMARTLNLAFFPFRFEYKVASIMARSLAKTAPLTQLAVVNGLYRAHDWLNSTEGQAWYSQNAEVIGLIKYFTPIQTLGEVSTLLGGHPDSVGAFGELGGLPFGWIPQLLDAEGLTNFGGVYVSPKTGQALPDYIPASDKGKLVSAIQDLIGSIYTYPGATAGLPSKTSLDRNIALGVTGASTKNDFTKVTPQIPADQQNFAQTVQGLSNQTLGSQQNVQTAPSAPQLQPGTQVPTQSSPLTTVTPRPAKSGGTKKLKKAQFTPQLLPGQTSLGQLP